MKSSIIAALLLCNFINIESVSIFLKEKQELQYGIEYAIYGSTEFPLLMHVVMVPTTTIFKIETALGQREEVSSIAARHKAYIAINGSNYRRGGNFNGNRVNLLYANRSFLADVQQKRGSFGWTLDKAGSMDKPVIGNTKLHIRCCINDEPIIIDSLNQPRGIGQSVIYTTENTSKETLPLNYNVGKYILIRKNDVNGMLEVYDILLEAPATVAYDHYVIHIDKDAYSWIRKGMKATVSMLVSCDNATTNVDYDFMLGGAGLLIKDGKFLCNDILYEELAGGMPIVHCHDEIAADFSTRAMQEWLINLRHPRTAIGITSNDTICIVVVDGRQDHSEGLTLKELTLIMNNFGCVDALNIGGGGCSTLWIDGKVVNKPSQLQERPVSESICIFGKN